jgi:hypothetical protein
MKVFYVLHFRVMINEVCSLNEITMLSFCVNNVKKYRIKVNDSKAKSGSIHFQKPDVNRKKFPLYNSTANNILIISSRHPSLHHNAHLYCFFELYGQSWVLVTAYHLPHRVKRTHLHRTQPLQTSGQIERKTQI